MKLVKELGKKETGYVDSRGYIHRATYGIFECSVCKKHYELRISKGTNRITCVDCRGTQNITHGKAGTREYSIWQAMFQRCNNPKNKKYRIYGAKGITVDSNWNTFEGFWKDMSEGYTPEMTIDRIDSSKGYSKDNCRWVTKAENSSKTSKVRPVIQYTLNPNNPKEWIKAREWESAKKAADELNIIAAHIAAVCKNQRKTHGGFHWQYIKED